MSLRMAIHKTTYVLELNPDFTRIYAVWILINTNELNASGEEEPLKGSVCTSYGPTLLLEISGRVA